MAQITLNEIVEKLSFFGKMYDVVRLVDPIGKRVIEYQDSALNATPDVCYDYWGTGKICDNCISIRSYQENRTFWKLERKADAIFLVTALPVEDADGTVILELLKIATDSMLVGNGDYNEGEVFHRLVREISDMIVKDQLTSLYNRRFVSERLPADIVEATLNQLPLAVCFLDLDNLKAINDLYGHQAGDLALQAVGEVLNRQIRLERDWAARYGGDEYLLCLNNTDAKQAGAVGERIQKAIEALPLSLPEGQVRLSVSFGVAAMEGAPLTAEELIGRADKHMYQTKMDKQSGKE